MSLSFPQRFPETRLRRLRQADWLRRLNAETILSPQDLIWSIIVHDGSEPQIPVSAMPGVSRLNIHEAASAARRAAGLGIPALAIFPHINPSLKDETGREALNRDGLIPRCIQAIKAAAPDIGIICDVALDPYTTHGHDGLIDEAGRVQNDETVAILVEQALMQVEAGADIVAPSDMMDGRIGALRHALEAEGHDGALILSYAAKYASGFYGPYREAIGSASALIGDKKTYQQDPSNSDEALREVALDLAEGADMVMVKPGLPYLDIIRRITDSFAVPTYAFQVSGEYAMIQAAAQQGWIDGEKVMLESLMSFKRAGASGIITYFGETAARKLG